MCLADLQRAITKAFKYRNKKKSARTISAVGAEPASKDVKLNDMTSNENSMQALKGKHAMSKESYIDDKVAPDSSFDGKNE